ncbi:MAG: dihydroxy-acid dehydratase, partial [Deltaproteobacteria bacterium]|nr:dihydroxy-acid dehydratase [Deltaproteobacteria bacterium]
TSAEIITRESLVNAIRVLHAIGGSTNAVVHLLAIGYEMGFDVDITLELVERCGQETPCLAAVRP